jgi:beta-galactosidase/beta-glucuronidase
LFVCSCEPISLEKQSLNGDWNLKYDPDNIGLRDGWFDKDHDRTDWETEVVPGDWSDNNFDGYAWYATKIQAGNYPSGYKLALVFDSVDDNAYIW